MPLEVEVPKFISDNAERGLRYVSEGKGGDGMTDKTIREARDMVSGRISKDKVRRMGPWFARHRVDMDAPANDPDNEAFPGKGAVAWLVWGGSTSGDKMDAAKWAERTARRLDEEEAHLTGGATLESDMDTIENKLSAALEAITAKDGEVAEARASFEKVATENLELTEKVAALTKQVAALESEKAALISKAEALAASAVTASEEAAKIAASVGVTPVESSPADAPVAKTDDDIRAEFLAMPHGIERTRFYQANRAVLNPARRR